MDSIVEKAEGFDLLDNSESKQAAFKNIKPNFVDQEAEEDNDSAEDLDSDDLGDDLEDN